MPLYNPFQKIHFSCVWNTVFGCFQHTVFVCFCLNRFFWFVLRQWNFTIHLLKLWNNFILTLAWKTPLTWAVYLAQPKRKLLHAQAVIRGLNTKIQHLTVITVEKRLKWLKTPNGLAGRLSVAGLNLNFPWIFTSVSILILNQPNCNQKHIILLLLPDVWIIFCTIM